MFEWAAFDRLFRLIARFPHLIRLSRYDLGFIRASGRRGWFVEVNRFSANRGNSNRTYDGLQYLADTGIVRLTNSVIDPFTLTAGRDNAGTAKIGQVPRDLWLAFACALGEKANGDRPICHQGEQAKACLVGKGEE